MSSQSELQLSEFLQNFSSISLHHKKPKSYFHPWVFWSEYEGCENNSTSADVGTPINIHDNIISALSNIKLYWGWNCLGQFWAPVTIGGRRLLSTSAQPFAVRPLSNNLAKYRLNSEKYKYNIDDANKPRIEPDHNMIKSGGPATAFLNCRISMGELQGFLSESDDYGGLNFATAFLNCRISITKLQGFLSESDDYGLLDLSVMIPICLPSQSTCIGVLEFTFYKPVCPLALFLFHTVKAIKNVGLDVFYVKDLIPYTTINGLKVAKDHIEEALKVVGESYDLALAQVWIPYEDKTRVFLPSSLEDTQTKQLLAIKLTGCYYTRKDGDPLNSYQSYFSFSDVTPRAIGEGFPLVTLQDYKSRYISKLRTDMVMCWGHGWVTPTSALVICLRSNDTSDCNYVFEFIWKKDSNFIHLEALLLTLKRCLPRFKFASGVEIGNELDVYIEGDATGAELGDEIDIHTEDDETKKVKIFQGKRSMVVDYISHSKVTCKTTPKVLPREVIEKQFGKTMKDAAKNLNVSLSTLKRKSKEVGIPEWPGPNYMKRNANGSSIVQSNTNEEDNGAIEDTSTVSLNKNELTIKAEYKGDITKFHLPISQATFVHVEKEIGKRLELSDKTYKLKYLDEDGDWITLKSDEEMADCIKSSRKSNRVVVRIQVLPM